MSFPPTGVRRRALARPLTRLTRRPHPCDDETREQAILRCLARRDYGVLSNEELEDLEKLLAGSDDMRGSTLHKRVCEAMGLPEPHPPASWDTYW